jgi:hypothetical protein
METYQECLDKQRFMVGDEVYVNKEYKTLFDEIGLEVNGHGPFKVLAVHEVDSDIVEDVGHSQHLVLSLKYRNSFGKEREAQEQTISGAFFA